MLVACNRPHNAPVEVQDVSPPPIVVSPELSAIDSLMWQQPDSALALLCRDVACNVSECNTDGFGDVARYVSTTERDRHYYQLLLAELRYKNDSAQANRAELRQAVAYFDSLVRQAPPSSLRAKRGNPRGQGGLTPPNPTDDLFFLSARAHYINGVGYYEHDSMVEACREYLTALETMEGHFGEKDFVWKKAKFMALTYTHLTVLFSDMYLHEQAIYFGKQALWYYKKHDATPWHVAWILDEIGSHYDMMDEYDSADFYYRKSLSVVPDTNSLIYRDIATHLAYLSYKKEGTSQPSLYKLHNLLSQAESEKEYLSRCLSIGTIFYHEQQFDSAIIYMNMVYNGNSSIDSKLFTAQKLQELYLINGDTATANTLARFRSQFANTRDQYGDQYSELAEQYHAHIQRRQEMLHQRKMRSQMKWSVSVIVLLTFLGGVLMLLNFVNKKRHKHLKTQNEENEHRLRQHSATIGRLKSTMVRLQAENKELNDRIEHADMIQAEKPKIRKTEYVALVNEDICISIRQRLKKAEAYSSFDVKAYASLALSDKEMEELVHAIDQHCPDFSKRMKSAYPGLSANDLQLCRLYLLDLSVLQVAILLGTDYSSIRKRTNRLKEKTGSEELCRNLKSTLFEE